MHERARIGVIWGKATQGTVAAAALALAAGLLTSLPGCEQGGKSAKPSASTHPTSSTKDHGSGAVPITKDYASPVVRSDLREAAIDSILACGRSRDASVRANATEAALLAPPRLESLVAAGLKDDNLGVRSVAAVVVGKARIKSLTPAVRPLLSDSSPFVRSSAIFALRKCGEEVDPSPLSNYLMSDPSPKVRAHAAYLLGELGDKSAAAMIRSAVKKTMPRAAEADLRLMQLQFAEALVKLGDEGQIQSIRAALYPARLEELEATALAVQIIGGLKDQGAVDQLIYLSAKADKAGNPMPAEIRLGVAAAMAQLGNRRGNFIAEEFWNDPNAVLKAQSASVFGFTGVPQSLAYLERMMLDPSEQVRVAASAGMLRALGTDEKR